MSDEPKKNQTSKKDKTEEGRKNWLAEKFTVYRAEFRKIVWPSREDLLKHTVTVIVVSLIFGAYIALLDGAFGWSFTALVNAFIS